MSQLVYKGNVITGVPEVTTVDSIASGNTNPVTSNAVYKGLAAKQNTLTFDSTPKSGSSNPVTSGGVYTALAKKQDTISGGIAGQVWTSNGEGEEGSWQNASDGNSYTEITYTYTPPSKTERSTFNNISIDSMYLQDFFDEDTLNKENIYKTRVEIDAEVYYVYIFNDSEVGGIQRVTSVQKNCKFVCSSVESEYQGTVKIILNDDVPYNYVYEPSSDVSYIVEDCTVVLHIKTYA